MSLATNEDIARYHSDFIAGDGFTGKQLMTWSTRYIQSSESGTYGDPTVAAAETGREIMKAAVENGTKALIEYWKHPREGMSLNRSLERKMTLRGLIVCWSGNLFSA